MSALSEPSVAHSRLAFAFLSYILDVCAPLMLTLASNNCKNCPVITWCQYHCPPDCVCVLNIVCYDKLRVGVHLFCQVWRNPWCLQLYLEWDREFSMLTGLVPHLHKWVISSDTSETVDASTILYITGGAIMQETGLASPSMGCSLGYRSRRWILWCCPVIGSWSITHKSDIPKD